MKERRQHERVTIMGLLMATLPGEKKPREVYLANISRGGIGIYLRTRVRPGQKMVFTLSLRDKDDRFSEKEIRGVVRWVDPAGELFMAGIQFEKLFSQEFEDIVRGLHLVS